VNRHIGNSALCFSRDHAVIVVVRLGATQRTRYYVNSHSSYLLLYRLLKLDGKNRELEHDDDG
jgi:hypothetical protein